MLSVIYAECHLCRCLKIGLYAECHYAECSYAECRGDTCKWPSKLECYITLSCKAFLGSNNQACWAHLIVKMKCFDHDTCRQFHKTFLSSLTFLYRFHKSFFWVIYPNFGLFWLRFGQYWCKLWRKKFYNITPWTDKLDSLYFIIVSKG